MENEMLYSIGTKQKREHRLLAYMSMMLSLVFFCMALFGKLFWMRILGLLMFIFLLFIGVLTYKVSNHLLNLEIKKDEMRFFTGKRDEKIVKKDEIKKLTLFNVYVDIPNLKIEDEYYVLSINTGKEDHRYLPNDPYTREKSNSIQQLIKALEEMGKNVELKEIIIDKLPKNRHEFAMEYPERYGHEKEIKLQYEKEI